LYIQLARAIDGKQEKNTIRELEFRLVLIFYANLCYVNYQVKL